MDKFANNIVKNSRLSPTGNGTFNNNNIDPTSGQKTWVAILIGLMFFVVASPIVDVLFGVYKFNLTNLIILIIKTIIFIILIRLLMW